MGRTITEFSKIVRRRDNPPTKHRLPDAIDIDTCRLWVVAIAEILGKFKPAAAFTFRHAVLPGEDLQKM